MTTNQAESDSRGVGERLRCRVCGATAGSAGSVWGAFSERDYELARCGTCGFAFVADPWRDFAAIYDDRYYAGRGADPHVDYLFELNHPTRTVRVYEWQGIASVVNRVLSSDDDRGRRETGRSLRWLDYGCGAGGLVRHLRARGELGAVGFDEGAIVADARSRGIPILGRDELDAGAGSFDVVTAIEVLEHTVDPIAELCRMRRLLREGGLLLLTTGNAQPYASKLTHWRYVVPEIHVSFFEPGTLARALNQAGFRVDHPPLGPGFNQILKFKVLKNLGIRRRSVATELIPATPVGRIADHWAKLSAHPLGWAA